MLSFSRSSQCNCKWNATDFLIVDSSNIFLSMGSKFSILSDKIKSICKSSRTLVCSSYPFTTSSIVSIQAPLNPLVPVLVAKVPTVVSGCDNIDIDMSSSYGHGGREWEYIGLMVNAKPSSYDCCNPTNLSDLQNYITLNLLNNKTDRVYILPNKFLNPGVDYTITITLKNFWEISVSNTYTTSVSFSKDIIQTNILGSSVVNLFRHQELYLNGEIKLSECSNIESNILEYSWKVYHNFIFMDDIISASGLKKILINRFD